MLSVIILCPILHTMEGAYKGHSMSIKACRMAHSECPFPPPFLLLLFGQTLYFFVFYESWYIYIFERHNSKEKTNLGLWGVQSYGPFFGLMLLDGTRAPRYETFHWRGSAAAGQASSRSGAGHKPSSWVMTLSSRTRRRGRRRRRKRRKKESV